VSLHLDDDISSVPSSTATPAKEHRVELVQPVLLRAPEVTLGHGWSTPIDVWSMGCLVRYSLLLSAIINRRPSRFSNTLLVQLCFNSRSLLPLAWKIFVFNESSNTLVLFHLAFWNGVNAGGISLMNKVRYRAFISERT
jgi:hypothetical protein